jgi:aminoglycoside phosphotransferase (APT) family kinase protein
MLERISPLLGARLNDWWDEVHSLAEADAPSEMTIAHGDYTPSQVLLDGDARGLIDLGTICLAEPALDLGRFCAYLRVGCQRARRAGGADLGDLATDLCERFVRAYQQGSGPRADHEYLRSRVALHEVVSLLRMASHSCYQLKAARTRDVVTVLEERMACLPTPTY